jgi:kelch repeat/BTB domain-containing protein 5/10
VTEQNQVFVAGGLIFNEDDKDEPLSSFFLQVRSDNNTWDPWWSWANAVCLGTTGLRFPFEWVEL